MDSECLFAALSVSVEDEIAYNAFQLLIQSLGILISICRRYKFALTSNIMRHHSHEQLLFFNALSLLLSARECWTLQLREFQI